MSTSTTLRLPLTIPDSVDLTKKFTVQLAVHGQERDGSIFLEQLYQPSDLTSAGEDERSRVLILPREKFERPQFSHEQETSLKAYFWKGQKLVGTADLGLI